MKRREHILGYILVVMSLTVLGCSDSDAGCESVGPWPGSVDGPFLVSRTAEGAPLTFSGGPSLSADGRLVAYHSYEDPTEIPENRLSDIFIYDAECDTTKRVPFVHPQDLLAEAIVPVMAADGSAVAFMSRNENSEAQILVYDVATGEIEVVGVDESNTPVLALYEGLSISADGRFVAFSTNAVLIAADANENADVYVYDRELDTNELVSLSTDGEQGATFSLWPSISADGRYVAFESASKFVEGRYQGTQVYVRDRQTDTTERASVSGSDSMTESGTQASISGDGRYVAWTSSSSTFVPDDTNGIQDVFVTDRESGTIERVSLDSDGTELSNRSFASEISADGSVVVMVVAEGPGSSPFQLWAKQRNSGTMVLLSKGPSGQAADNGIVIQPAISADGKWAAFESSATNLVDPAKAYAFYDAYAVRIP